MDAREFETTNLCPATSPVRAQGPNGVSNPTTALDDGPVTTAPGKPFELRVDNADSECEGSLKVEVGGLSIPRRRSTSLQRPENVRASADLTHLGGQFAQNASPTETPTSTHPSTSTERPHATVRPDGSQEHQFVTPRVLVDGRNAADNLSQVSHLDLAESH